MTQDEIIEMWNSVIKYAPSEVRIAEFAKLVTAKEREACAKVVKDYMKETAIMEARGCLASVAYDIRARGEA